MNFLLNFRSYEHGQAYNQNKRLYFERIYRFVLFKLLSWPLFIYASFEFYEIKQAFVIVSIQAAFYIVVLSALKIAKSKTLGSKHFKWISRSFNAFVFSYTTSIFYLLLFWNGNFHSVYALFMKGYLGGIIIMTMGLISTSWMMKSIQIVVGCIGTVSWLVQYDKDQIVPVIMALLSQTLCSSCFYYHDERDQKRFFLERYQINEQAVSLQAIINDINDSIVIYSSVHDRILYTNKSSDTLSCWDRSKSVEENMKSIRVIRYEGITEDGLKGSPIDNSKRDERIDETDSQHKYLKEDESMMTILDVFSHMKSAPNPSRKYLNCLLDAKYKKEEGQPESHYNIQILQCQYAGEAAWTFIIRDTTERDTIITLQDTNQYKSRLLASVSHELRTPLNASINLTEKAIESTNVPNLIKDSYLRPSLNSSKMLLNLINDILDYSQVQAGKLRLVFQERSIIDTVNDCIQLVKILADKKGVYLKLTGLDEVKKDPIFYTDHNRVRQIILNLVSNALKFTYEGGITLYLQLDHRAESNANKVSNKQQLQKTARQRKIIRITVEDTGIGIKPEDQAKLFKAFEKVDLGEKISLNPTGVGLGLVISNNLASSLGPSDRKNPIEVDSVEGMGTKFSFEIVDQIGGTNSTPGSQNEVTDLKSCEIDIMSIAEHEFSLHFDFDRYNIKPQNNSRFEGTFLGGTSIYSNNPLLCSLKSSCNCPQVLIVDDDMFNISALEVVLSSYRLKTEPAFNGKLAIQKYIQRETKKCCKGCQPYSMIFMDCSMPVMDGFEATRTLKQMMSRKEVRACPIIGCTAHVQAEEMERGNECGMDDYVTKPIMASVVKQLIEKFIEGNQLA